MPEEATMEAPVVESTGGETSSQEQSFSEESTQSTGAEKQGESGAEQQEASQTPVKGDLRSLLKDPAKREALKALDPSLPGLLRDALHGREQLMKEFPGGLNEAVEFRKIVHEMGGREGLQEVRQTVDDYSNLDTLYTEGKPEFVQQIAEGDPEAFSRMVPHAIEQFAKVNPEHYQHIMARVLVNTFDGVGLSNALKGLIQSADDKAKPGIQEILDYVESFRPIAAKVPEKKVDAREQQLTQKEQEFAQRQAESLMKSVDTDSIRHRDSVIEREIKPFGDWQTMDPDRKGAVASWISQRIGKALSADRNFIERRQRLIANGDREGLAKLERDKLSEMVPKLVPQAAKVFGVTKNAAKPAQQPAKQSAQPAKPAPKGFTMVKSAPNPANVDRSKTTSDMIFANQAVLKNGSRIQWA